MRASKYVFTNRPRLSRATGEIRRAAAVKEKRGKITGREKTYPMAAAEPQQIRWRRSSEDEWFIVICLPGGMARCAPATTTITINVRLNSASLGINTLTKSRRKFAQCKSNWKCSRSFLPALICIGRLRGRRTSVFCMFYSPLSRISRALSTSVSLSLSLSHTLSLSYSVMSNRFTFSKIAISRLIRDIRYTTVFRSRP